MILDTTVLIDLHRELRQGRGGPAAAFLSVHQAEQAFISVITFGEFAEGFREGDRELCSDILRHYARLDITEAVAWHYASLSKQLRTRGERIGDNDLWIAATALAHQRPLATRNTGDFRRVDGLTLLTY